MGGQGFCRGPSAWFLAPPVHPNGRMHEASAATHAAPPLGSTSTTKVRTFSGRTQRHPSLPRGTSGVAGVGRRYLAGRRPGPAHERGGHLPIPALPAALASPTGGHPPRHVAKPAPGVAFDRLAGSAVCPMDRGRSRSPNTTRLLTDCAAVRLAARRPPVQRGCFGYTTASALIEVRLARIGTALIFVARAVGEEDAVVQKVVRRVAPVAL